MEDFPTLHGFDDGGYREISANELSAALWDIVEIRILPNKPQKIRVGGRIQFRAYGVLDDPESSIVEINPVWECGEAGILAALLTGQTDQVEFTACEPGKFSISARLVTKKCVEKIATVEVEIMSDEKKEAPKESAKPQKPPEPIKPGKPEEPTQISIPTKQTEVVQEVSLRETSFHDRQEIQRGISRTSINGAFRVSEVLSPIQNKDAWAGGMAYLFFAYGVNYIEKYFGTQDGSWNDLKQGLLSLLAFAIFAIVKNSLPAGPFSDWLKQSSKKAIDDVRKTLTGS